MTTGPLQDQFPLKALAWEGIWDCLIQEQLEFEERNIWNLKFRNQLNSEFEEREVQIANSSPFEFLDTCHPVKMYSKFMDDLSKINTLNMHYSSDDGNSYSSSQPGEVIGIDNLKVLMNSNESYQGILSKFIRKTY